MAEYYVATNGNNDNPGSVNFPWATIQHAVDQAIAGDTIYIRIDDIWFYLKPDNITWITAIGVQPVVWPEA